MTFPLPLDEPQRLAALDRYEIMATSPEAAFDRITELAARLFNVPIALISVIGEKRQWFKSCRGLGINETSRDISFCTHAILDSEVLVVQDTHEDARFAGNPLVTGMPGIRFYAGAPVQAPDGYNIGALCVLATEPRDWSEDDSIQLAGLAAIVADEIELRYVTGQLRTESEARQNAETGLARSREQFQSLVETGSDIIAILNADGTIRDESPSIQRLLGYKSQEITGKNAYFYVHPADVSRVEEAFSRLAQTTAQVAFHNFRWKHADGSWRVVEAIGTNHLDNPNVRGIVINARDITDRIEAEEALHLAHDSLEERVQARTAELSQLNADLQEARDQLQAVLDAVPGGVSWISANHRYLGINQYLANMFQLSTEEIKGRSIESLDISPEFTNFVRDVFRSTARASAQEIAVAVNGRQGVFLVIAQKYKNGRAAVFVGVDITKRHMVEAALQKAEEKYRGIFENAIEGMFQASPDGRYLSVNPALAQNYGYDSPEELISSVTDIGRQLYVDPARHAEFIRLMEEQGFVDDFDAQVYRKDGGAIWISQSARTSRDGDGTSIYYEGFVDDITARKQAADVLQRSHEELEVLVKERTIELTQANESLHAEVAVRQNTEIALRQSEARKAAILETALDCIISIDDQGRVIEWNPASENILGYSNESSTGRLLGEMIVPPALRDPDCLYLHSRLNTPDGIMQGQRMEVPVLRADGSEITAEMSIVRIPLPGLPQFTVYLQDITERKRADESVRQSRAEAEAANRAKSEFLSRMSHELRTPLNGILGFAQVLQMDFASGMHRDIVDDIYSAGKHLLALINEVLDISRIESGNLSLSIEPVSVREITQENLDLISPLAQERGIAIFNEVPAEDHHVRADRQRLAQCLLNLLSNAVKYNREAGTLTLTCRSSETGRLRVEVRDTGIGISAENKERVFTPFDRLGAEQTNIEGTGLGLALTKRLVEAMGGSIGVSSEQGSGSTFWIELSQAVAPSDQLAAQNLAISSTPLSAIHRTVLYIEDNLANFKVIELVLTHRPSIKLIAAMQGSLGLDLAIQHQPDLILLDLNLPDMHGIDVLHRLKENRVTLDIPVIILSADATQGQITRAMEEGARAYLTKPLDVPHFLQVIDETLEGLSD